MMEETIRALREEMVVLDHDPEELASPRALDPEFIQQYEETVQTYLERKTLDQFLQTVLENPPTTLLTDDDAVAPTEIMAASEEETERTAERLIGLVQTIDTASIQLKTSLALARSKRDALEALITDAETNNRMILTQVDDVDDDAKMDMVDVERRNDELDAEKERLHRRKVQLLHQIQVKESENDRVVKDNDLLRKQIEAQRDRLPGHFDVEAMLQNPSMLEQFEKENKEGTERKNKLKEIKKHFTNLALCVEGLSGVRAVQLVRSAQNRDGTERHLATFQLLGKHNVELLADISSVGRLHVLTASFVPECPVFRSPADEYGNVVQLTAAPLQPAVDAMNLIPWKTAGERLNYFLLETVNMLTALEKRANELFKLKQVPDVLTKIPPVLAYGEQEIVCSMTYLQLSCSLHLNRNCPIAAPSVFIKELAGFGGWKEEIVQQLSTFLQAKEFATPLALVNALKEEVERMEEEEGLQIPETPRFGVHKNHDWD
jgi:hypothetical protein